VTDTLLQIPDRLGRGFSPLPPHRPHHSCTHRPPPLCLTASTIPMTYPTTQNRTDRHPLPLSSGLTNVHHSTATSRLPRHYRPDALSLFPHFLYFSLWSRTSSIPTNPFRPSAAYVVTYSLTLIYFQFPFHFLAFLCIEHGPDTSATSPTDGLYYFRGSSLFIRTVLCDHW
jgi:hypothetical protein